MRSETQPRLGGSAAEPHGVQFPEVTFLSREGLYQAQPRPWLASLPHARGKEDSRIRAHRPAPALCCLTAGKLLHPLSTTPLHSQDQDSLPLPDGRSRETESPAQLRKVQRLSRPCRPATVREAGSLDSNPASSHRSLAMFLTLSEPHFLMYETRTTVPPLPGCCEKMDVKHPARGRHGVILTPDPVLSRGREREPVLPHYSRSSSQANLEWGL